MTVCYERASTWTEMKRAALREPMFRLVRGTAAGDLLTLHRRQYSCYLQAIANCPVRPSTRDVALTFGVSDLSAREMICEALGQPAPEYRKAVGQ